MSGINKCDQWIVEKSQAEKMELWMTGIDTSCMLISLMVLELEHFKCLIFVDKLGAIWYICSHATTSEHINIHTHN